MASSLFDWAKSRVKEKKIIKEPGGVYKTKVVTKTYGDSEPFFQKKKGTVTTEKRTRTLKGMFQGAPKGMGFTRKTKKINMETEKKD